MNAKTLEAITKHGQSLLAAFPHATERDPVALCKKLRRIENAVSRVTTDYCNGDATLEQCDAACDKAKNRVQNLLGWAEDGGSWVFINRDPRGHALKLDDEWTREYNRNLNRVPKCCACGCDALACSSINAHTLNEQKKNLNAIAEWRGKQSLRIHTDMGGYGILAPDLNQ